MMSERLFRLILLLYPRAFREDYGKEMLELLRHRARRGEWRVILLDLTRSLVAERWDALGRSSSRRRLSTMPDFIDDVRYAGRRLVATPLFSALAVLVLALGLGANTASFSIVNAFLLRPPPFASPDRLVDIYQDSDEGVPSSSSFPAYRDIAAHTQLFENALAAFPRSVSYERDDTTEDVFAEYATSSYLDVLGMRPTMGRWFAPAEDRPGAGATAVVSYTAWRTKLGGDFDVLGRVVHLNGAPVTIVGVGPERLVSLNPPAITDFWLSLSSLSDTLRPGAERTLERRQDHWFLVKARLQEGVGVAEARAGMDVLAERLAREYPRTSLFYRPYSQVGGTRRYVLVRTPEGVGPRLDRLREAVKAVDPSLPILELTTLDERLSAALQLPRFVATAASSIGVVALLLAGVGLYAIVAFVVSQRTREVGIRMSMGARGADIARLVLVETAGLVAAGLAIGLGLALVLAPTLEGVLYGTRPTDPATFLAVALIVGLAALLASYVPARRAASLDPVRALRQA